MAVPIAILCSDQAASLAVLIEAVDSGRLPAEIKIVVADRDSEALRLAREAGLYGAFIPRSAFHANRDGFERRLAEVFQKAGAKAVALADYGRELGPVLTEAFGGAVFGQGLSGVELEADLAKRLRARLFDLVS